MVAESSRGVTDEAPPAVFLMGPTASGKTALAVELARRYPLEIISVDSAQVYRGLDIGTAKPSFELRREVPHHLVDIAEPTEAYSAARFRDDALAAMREITRAGKIPLLAGGTMLYFRALLQGLSQLPAASPEIRQQLDAQARREGWPAMHRRLAEVDPAAAARIHPHDSQRIQRALEVHAITGTAMTELYARATDSVLECRVIRLAVAPTERAELHRRIGERFHAMMAAGFEDEVAALMQRPGMQAALPAMRAVGYRQLAEYLSGQRGREEAIERGIIATRQLAKRQLTWLRRESGLCWLDSDDPGLFSRTVSYLRQAGVSL